MSGEHMVTTTAANPAGNPTNIRDGLIIAAFLVAAVIAYFIFSAAPQTPPDQFVHPEVPGMMPELDMVPPDLPQDYSGLVASGNQFMDKGQYHTAMICYTRALAMDSSSPDVRVDLGACQHALGMVDSAIVQFNRALVLEPDHAVAHFNLGIAYLSQNEREKTIQNWEKYLELAPGSPMADTVRGFINMLKQQVN